MRNLNDSARSFRQRAEQQGWDLQTLVAGQRPEVLFISCSDSRVMPAHITQATPGDLFELRTAGNIVPVYDGRQRSGEAATIEYAVSVLEVSQIVVCGHSHCGAVAALVDGDDLVHLPSLHRWLAQHRDVVASVGSSLTGEPGLVVVGQHHAVTQMERLRRYPEVRDRVRDGSLTLTAWFYDLATGRVQAWAGDRFQTL
ncbi:carbonic anhydrase [Couchioplanes caeruleus]|uniref:Carbonic anhydrase n=2 Tax=Couchioplanes caeruleus TaxID=56438 RepID=A0A1K0GFX1_9ACTN|nr:carbonic anhydrase [Couchioplanes caeruleus]OJF11062.1 hypothetical protein BG844_28340 [Couchioplanes caeruleus subsp. caeruleus]ROP33680.1 carbonic anhydrase [Couchioplanes caeruleus]